MWWLIGYSVAGFAIVASINIRAYWIGNDTTVSDIIISALMVCFWPALFPLVLWSGWETKGKAVIIPGRKRKGAQGDRNP